MNFDSTSLKFPQAASVHSPTVVLTEFTDPTDVTKGSDCLQVLDQDVVSLSTKPFFAKRVAVSLNGNIIIYQETSHKLRTHTKVQQGQIAFMAIGPRAKGTLDGRKLRPGMLIAAAPGAQAQIVVDPGYSSVTFLIEAEELMHHLELRGRQGDFRVPENVDFVSQDIRTTHAFFDVGKRISDKAARYPNLFGENERIRTTALLEILETLFDSFDLSDSLEPTRRDTTKSSYSDVTKTAEAYCLDNIDARFSIADLCRASNVSERKLQLCFNEIMGMSPIAYLTQLRLHRSRAQLRKASKTDTTVAAVALNWGFWHFGDFSRAYKKCFQELPSETLRSKPKQK
jgi:AraC family ethanolamine operon transcriptional activator